MGIECYPRLAIAVLSPRAGYETILIYVWLLQALVRQQSLADLAQAEDMLVN